MTQGLAPCSGHPVGERKGGDPRPGLWEAPSHSLAHHSALTSARRASTHRPHTLTVVTEPESGFHCFFYSFRIHLGGTDHSGDPETNKA